MPAQISKNAKLVQNRLAMQISGVCCYSAVYSIIGVMISSLSMWF